MHSRYTAHTHRLLPAVGMVSGLPSVFVCHNSPSIPHPPTPPTHTACPRFTFDHVYDQDSSQEEVYNSSAKPLVLSTLQGYNAAIIAYGQTGTGKT